MQSYENNLIYANFLESFFNDSAVQSGAMGYLKSGETVSKVGVSAV